MNDTINNILKTCNWWGLLKNYIIIVILIIVMIFTCYFQITIKKVEGTVKKIIYCKYTEKTKSKKSGFNDDEREIYKLKEFTCLLIVEFTINGNTYFGCIEDKTSGKVTSYRIDQKILLDYTLDSVMTLKKSCTLAGVSKAEIDRAKNGQNPQEALLGLLAGDDVYPVTAYDLPAWGGEEERVTNTELNHKIGILMTTIPNLSRFCQGDEDHMIEASALKAAECATPGDCFVAAQLVDAAPVCIPIIKNEDVATVGDNAEAVRDFLNIILNKRGISEVELSTNLIRLAILVISFIIFLWVVLWTYLRRNYAHKKWMKYIIGWTCFRDVAQLLD